MKQVDAVEDLEEVGFAMVARVPVQRAVAHVAPFIRKRCTLASIITCENEGVGAVEAGLVAVGREIPLEAIH